MRSPIPSTPPPSPSPLLCRSILSASSLHTQPIPSLVLSLSRSRARTIHADTEAGAWRAVATAAILVESVVQLRDLAKQVVVVFVSLERFCQLVQHALHLSPVLLNGVQPLLFFLGARHCSRQPTTTPDMPPPPPTQRAPCQHRSTPARSQAHAASVSQSRVRRAASAAEGAGVLTRRHELVEKHSHHNLPVDTSAASISL